MSIDIDLNEQKTTPAPRRSSPSRKKEFTAPPKKTEADLYMHLQQARDALFCGDYKSCAYEAYRVADVVADLITRSPAVYDAVQADLPNIPSPYGDWSGSAYVVWVTEFVLRREGDFPNPFLPETGSHCPERCRFIHDS